MTARSSGTLAVALMGLVAGCASLPEPEGAEERIAVEPQAGIHARGLATRVRLRVPPTVTNVGELTDYLLESTGYQLVLYCKGCPEDAPRIARDPISPLAFVSEGKTMRAERAIKLALGMKARMVIDHEVRSLSFEFLPDEEVRAGRTVREGEFTTAPHVVARAAPAAAAVVRQKSALAAIEARAEADRRAEAARVARERRSRPAPAPSPTPQPETTADAPTDPVDAVAASDGDEGEATESRAIKRGLR